MKILITGANGMIAKELVLVLQTQNIPYHTLSRSTSDGTHHWDPTLMKIDPKCIQGVTHIVHLAGANVGDGIWTHARKKEIIHSRVKSTQLLLTLLQKHSHQVKKIIMTSAIGYYGISGSVLQDEGSNKGNTFLSDVWDRWEQFNDDFVKINISVVTMRLGVVLHPKSGVYPNMLMPLRMYIAPQLGGGLQWVSWVDYRDVIHAILFFINNHNTSGIYNIVTANNTWKELMQLISKKIHKRSWEIHIHKAIIKLVLGEQSDILLHSTKVSNEKIINAGVEFKHINI